MVEQTKINTKEYFVIDLAHIIKTLIRRAWVIVLVSFVGAGIGFSVSTFAIAPTYSSSIMLYVNNSSFTVGDIGFSISSSEISAAQSLVKTYTVLLKNRTTLEDVIDATGVDYNWKELYDMIEAAPVNETEIMGVTVTCKDPNEAAKIANGIAKVLPRRISEVVEGSSMEVVDSAIPIKSKVAPNITGYTAVGFVLGALLSIICLVIVALVDNTIHDEEYVLNTYNYPILAKIPDLLETPTKKYGYYQHYYKKK